MTDEQFKELTGKIDALNANLARTHAEEFQWANAIINRQAQFENRLGLDTTPRDFIPYYNPTLVPNPVYPAVFNKYGEPMEFFFISDRSFAHSPQQKNSRYIIWDRYNYGNETHFYNDEEVFRLVGKPKRRYAVISESPAIVTPAYENALKHRDFIEKNFVYLFTHDARLLANIKNARFVAFGATVWYGTNRGGVCMMRNKQGSRTKASRRTSSSRPKTTSARRRPFR